MASDSDKKIYTAIQIILITLGIAAAVGFVLITKGDSPLESVLIALFFLVFWIVGVLCSKYVDPNAGYYTGSGSGGSGHAGRKDSGRFNTDMTRDYYGRHGEFDSNDEARRVSEDMQQFHNCHPDAELTDQYYWDDVLDADTDDYL